MREHYTHREIAEHLGCSVQTVKRIQKQALDKLRERIEGDEALKAFLKDCLEEEPETNYHELIELILGDMV